LTIEERAEKAKEYKASGKYNCTQSVLKAYEDKLPVSMEEFMKMCSGFAAGMGCMESTCGALIGAVMVAGVLTDGQGTPRASKQILSSFNEKCGATLCKDLKGINTGKVLCQCPDCCKNAVLALGQLE